MPDPHPQYTIDDRRGIGRLCIREQDSGLHVWWFCRAVGGEVTLIGVETGELRLPLHEAQAIVDAWLADEGFALQVPRQGKRKAAFENNEAKSAKVLFSGADCLPGQTELFNPNGKEVDQGGAA